MDQAHRLRKLMENSLAGNNSRIIAISSGKGGVGKTNIAVNLAIALSKKDNRVTIIDADLGLSNVDVLFNIKPGYNLLDVIEGRVGVESLIVKGPHNINIISGGSGITKLVNLSETELENLIKSFGYFNSISDFIIIDTAAGIGKSVLSFVSSASELIVVVNPDPTSVTDAYALIKNAVARDNIAVKIIVNRVESNSEGEAVFQKLSQVTDKFLHLDIENLGYIYEDHNLRRAVRNQVPLQDAFPRSMAAKGIENVAINIQTNTNYDPKEGGFRSFLNRLIGKL